MIAAGLLALLAAAAAPATPPAAPAAKPKWVVDWGAKRCGLLREGSVASLLQVVPGTAEIQLFIFDRRWAKAPIPDDSQMTIAFTPTGNTVEANGKEAKTVDGRVGVRLAGLDRAFLDHFGGSNSFTVRSGDQIIAEVPTPGAGRAIAALRECETSALRDAGMDAATIMSLRSSAQLKGSPTVLLSNADYPDAAIRAGQMGTVIALLKIGADGVAKSCAVLDSSGSQPLDEQTCAIYVRRAHYDPAIDASGKPTIGLFVARVRWLLP